MGVCASKGATAQASAPLPVPVPQALPAAAVTAPSSTATPVAEAPVAVGDAVPPAKARRPPAQLPADAPHDLLTRLNLDAVSGPLRDRLVLALADPSPAFVPPHPSLSPSTGPESPRKLNGMFRSAAHAVGAATKMFASARANAQPPYAAAQSAGAALLHADAHENDGNASHGGALDWTARARIVFRAVDADNTGSVNADECAALVREVLQGAVGVGDGERGAALAEFLHDLADEDASVHASAIAAETEDMMRFAVRDGSGELRVDFDGFSAWLVEFMDSLVDEDKSQKGSPSASPLGGASENATEADVAVKADLSGAARILTPLAPQPNGVTDDPAHATQSNEAPASSDRPSSTEQNQKPTKAAFSLAARALLKH